VVAACLRNAAAIGEWAGSERGAISVIACGEQWPDGSLRPALEDLLGAGAVLSRLSGSRSPDARAAVAAWSDAASDIKATLLGCPSGQELLERGREDDVHYAAEAGVSKVIPVLRDGAFRAVALPSVD
jgi:2-phosphosulfolactate phosphatase